MKLALSLLSDFVSSCDVSWQQSVWTSVISASIASHHLKEGGVLVLMGALPAEQGTPGMLGYGMCKASVHQLTRSLGEEGSGLPRGSHALCALPGMICVFYKKLIQSRKAKMFLNFLPFKG